MLFTILRVAVSIVLLGFIIHRIGKDFRDRDVVGRRAPGHFLTVQGDDGKSHEVRPDNIIEGAPDPGERVLARVPGLFWGLFGDVSISGTVAQRPRSFAIVDDATGKEYVFEGDAVKPVGDKWKGKRPGIGTSLAGVPWWAFAVGLLVLFSLTISLSVRWWLLMRVQDIRLPLMSTVCYNYIGLFFNVLLPSLTGGDLVKIYYVVRETHKKTHAVATVLLDRVVGLVAMGFLALGALVFSLDNLVLRQVRIPEAVILFMGAIVAGALVFYSKGLRRLFHLKTILAKMPRILREFDEALFAYRRHPGTTAVVLLQSVAMHVVNIGVLYFYGRALGITQVTFTQYLLLVPIIFLVSMMPISLSGLGVREAAFALLFGLMGAPAAHAMMMSLLHWLTQTAVSLPGGLVYALRRDHVTRRQMEETIEQEEDDDLTSAAADEP